MPETWIVNTSPLVTLAKVGYLYLLTDMATQVLIPDAVAAEVLSGPSADPARQALLAGWCVPIEVGALP